MGQQAKAKREALGDKYIGKHGTNKLKGQGRGRHNHARLAKINEKTHQAGTLTQAKARGIKVGT